VKSSFLTVFPSPSAFRFSAFSLPFLSVAFAVSDRFLWVSLMGENQAEGFLLL